MNDEQYVEAARHLAERMMRAAASRPADRIVVGFCLATARRPTADELRILETLYAAERAEYARDTAAAKKLLSVGDSPHDESLDPRELAAWTMVANLILNLDETVTKG